MRRLGGWRLTLDRVEHAPWEETECEVLRRQVAARSDWTLERRAEELAKETGIKLKKSAVGNYLKRLGITHKLGPKAPGLILKRASSPLSEMS